MQKRILALTVFLMTNSPATNKCAETSSTTAGLTAHQATPFKKPTNFERLEKNFKELTEHFSTLEDTGLPSGKKGTTPAFNQKLATVQKLLTRFQDRTEKTIAEIDQEVERIVQATTQETREIPPLPKPYATTYYPEDEKYENFIFYTMDKKKYLDKHRKKFEQTIQLPRGFSPDRGWVIAHNGLIKSYMTELRHFQSPFKTLATYLFTLLQTGNIARTALPGNSAISLTPANIAQILRLLYNNLLSSEAVADLKNSPLLTDLIKRWHASDLQIKKMPGSKFVNNTFTKQCAKILDTIILCDQQNRQLTTDFLLAVVALEIERGQTPTDQAETFQQYVYGLLDKTVPIQWYDTENYLPNLIFYYNSLNIRQTLMNESNLLPLLAPTIVSLKSAFSEFSDLTKATEMIFFTSEDVKAVYQKRVFPCCGENVLRTLISLLFFDPATQTLSLQTAPEDLQAHISDELKTFISTYGTLTNPNWSSEERKKYITNSQNAWIELVENRKDISYNRTTANGEKYDITTSFKNIFTAFMQLLGIPLSTISGTPQEQFITVIKKFLTPKGPVEIKNKLNNAQEDVAIFQLTVPSLDFEIEINFSHRHASIKNVKKEVDLPLSIITGLTFLGEKTSQFLLGISNIQLGALIKALITGKDYDSFYPYPSNPYFTSSDQLKQFLLNDYSNHYYGSVFPQAFYTEEFYKLMNQKIVYDAAHQLGFTEQGALEYALSKQDIPLTLAILNNTTAKIIISENQKLEILQMANQGNQSQIDSLLNALQKQNFNFTKKYLFNGKEETPLLWTCSQQEPYLTYALLKHIENQQPLTPTELITVLEYFKNTDFIPLVQGIRGFLLMHTPYEPLFNNLNSFKIDINSLLPFTNGSSTLLDWALAYTVINENWQSDFQKKSLLQHLFKNPLVSYNPAQVVGFLETVASPIENPNIFNKRSFLDIIEKTNLKKIDFLRPYDFKEGTFTPSDWLEHTQHLRTENLQKAVKKEIDKKISEQIARKKEDGEYLQQLATSYNIPPQ